MALLLTILFLVAWALILAGAAFLLVAMTCVASFRPLGSNPGPLPCITVLKPLYGMEDGLADALRSFLAQRVDARLQFVFGVADPADPALKLARAVAAEFPNARSAFVADPRRHGANPKVSNLINMIEAADGEVIVLSDSDIVAAPGTLQTAVAALLTPGIGAVTSLYRACPLPSAGRAGVWGALNIDGWFLPKAVVHARLAPMDNTYGPLTAIRRETLDRIGGLQVLADSLSDDAELGRRVRALDLDIGFAPIAVETIVADATLGELFAHELRWARTARGLAPIGYGPMLVTQLGPIPLLLALCSPSWASIGAVVALVLLRWALLALVHARFGRAPAFPRIGPLSLWWRDQLGFAVWFAGLFARRVDWRGQRLTVGSGAMIDTAAR